MRIRCDLKLDRDMVEWYRERFPNVAQSKIINEILQAFREAENTGIELDISEIIGRIEG